MYKLTSVYIMASGNKVKKFQNIVGVIGLYATDSGQHNAATTINKRRIKIFLLSWETQIFCYEI